MIHVPRLKDTNAAELFLGFHIEPVCSCDIGSNTETRWFA